jgi:hypothetical protein
LQFFREALFLKGWLKLRKWYLLDLYHLAGKDQVNLWFISALRQPKRGFKYNKVVKIFSENKREAFLAQNALQYRKTIFFVRKHFKHKKKLLRRLFKTKNLNFYIKKRLHKKVLHRKNGINRRRTSSLLLLAGLGATNLFYKIANQKKNFSYIRRAYSLAFSKPLQFDFHFRE